MRCLPERNGSPREIHEMPESHPALLGSRRSRPAASVSPHCTPASGPPGIMRESHDSHVTINIYLSFLQLVIAIKRGVRGGWGHSDQSPCHSMGSRHTCRPSNRHIVTSREREDIPQCNVGRLAIAQFYLESTFQQLSDHVRH